MQSASINEKIIWAKNKGCSHLKLTTETSAILMDLSTGEEQIIKDTVNSVKIEPNEQIEQKNDSPLRETRNYFGGLYGYSHSNKTGGRIDLGLTYLWDFNSFWIEAILFSRLNIDRNNFSYYLDPGVRVLYPFSKKINTFYIGSGGGFSSKNGKYGEDDSYGFFAENSIGYTFLFRELPMKIEAFGTAMFHEEKSISGGLRFALSFWFYKKENLQNKEQVEIKKQIQIEEKSTTEEKAEVKKNRRKYFRLVVNGYQVQSPNEVGSSKGFNASVIVANVPIFERFSFESEVGLSFRNFGDEYSDYKLEEFAIVAPLILKTMPFGGPYFYVEAGSQIDIPFFTEFNHESYDSRANFDFGFVAGFGWNVGKSSSLTFRYVWGLTNFSKDENSFEKPIQLEGGISF